MAGLTGEQVVLFSLLGAVFALLLWGRIRYDLVAFGALVAAVVLGVVPSERAFEGFGHPAVIIIALVLIVSRGLLNSGAVEIITRYAVTSSRSVSVHIAIMAGIGAALSAVMNNVAALALLMPVDVQAAAKGERSPALTLMPLSVATIVGGLVTLIGTPPNIVVASFRGEALGEPFHMFDFAPVGIVVAVAGVVFVALAGWRLIPAARRQQDSGKELFNLEDYVAEARATEGSKIISKRMRELDDEAEEADAAILGLVRRGERLPGQARREVIRKDDVLVIEGSPRAIEELAGALELEFAGAEKYQGSLASPETGLIEVVVPYGARAEGRSAVSLRLLYRHGVSLLGISRRGVPFRERVRRVEIQPGDILLLYGSSENLNEVSEWLGTLPLADRGLQVTQRGKATLTIAIFAAAIALASFGVLALPVALAGACVALALFNIVPPRQFYEAVEWPVIVLLGSLIPIGAALEQSGGTGVIAKAIVDVSSSASPAIVLTLLMVVTMTLSDVLNNTTTAVITAPIALDIANRLSVNPDPFLMAVAVASSCAFLTPIGHKNNTLILGPGGYRFGDYWRMGLPLEILVMAVAVPMILWVWPF